MISQQQTDIFKVEQNITGQHYNDINMEHNLISIQQEKKSDKCWFKCQKQQKDLNIKFPTDEMSKAKESEIPVLNLSGLKVDEDLHICDIPISYKGLIQFIHTTKCGDANKQDLVLVHGYGGSGVTFIKMLKKLSQHFRVWCIDLLGMGLSSRPVYDIENTYESIEFFVDSIEQWRDYLNLKDFILCGHSLGGYISTQYTLKYKQYIKQLNLISPAGVTAFTQEQLQIMDQQVPKSFLRKNLSKVAKFLWNKKLTPTRLFNKFQFMSKYGIKIYVSKRWGFQGEEANLIVDYFYKMMQLPESSELALHQLLQFPRAQGVLPLENLIYQQLKDIKINFYFGDIDWMNRVGASRLSQKMENVNFNILSNSGHHINIDNHEDLCLFIIQYFQEDIQSEQVQV